MDKLTQALCGTVTVPKTLVIHNKKLGFLNLVLTVFFVAVALFNVITPKAYLEVSIPLAAGLAIWMDTNVVRSPDVVHCTDVASFKYDFSTTYIYNPTRCQVTEPGEEYSKFPGSLFVPTYIADTHYEYRGSSNPVSTNDEFLVKAPEKQKIFISHGFTVPQPDFLGTSTDVLTVSALQGDILTVVVDSSDEQKDCKVDGKAVWSKADLQVAGGISGTLEEFLTCAGKKLDDIGGQAYVSTLGTLPTYRVSGLEVSFQFEYYNADATPAAIAARHPHNGVTAVLHVIATDAWNSEIKMAYSTPPSSGVSGNVDAGAKFRRRFQSGVTIKARALGTFKFWNYNALIAALVQALVFISLPPTIIKLLAFSVVGVLSKVYKRVATEELDIMTRLPGLAARLMTQTGAFRVLTDQPGGKNIDRGMTAGEMKAHMTEALRKQTKEGILDETEIQRMVEQLMVSLDPTGGNDISVDEFLAAASSNEDLSMEDLAKLYDQDRKLSLGEKCLGNVSTAGVNGLSKVVPEQD